VPLLKIVFVAAALVAVLGRYFQELHRLGVIKRLEPAEARRYFESTRQSGETMMLVLTAVLAAGAIAAMVYTFVVQRP
jgi:hypothetical protein